MQSDRRCYCAVQQDLVARVEVLGHGDSSLGELRSVSRVPPASGDTATETARMNTCLQRRDLSASLGSDPCDNGHGRFDYVALTVKRSRDAHPRPTGMSDQHLFSRRKRKARCCRGQRSGIGFKATFDSFLTAVAAATPRLALPDIPSSAKSCIIPADQ